MRFTIGLIALAAALATATAALAAEPCDALATIMQNGHDLSPLRGKQLGDGAWQSTAMVAGFDSCDIETYKDGLLLKCAGAAYPPDQRDASYAALNTLIDSMWSCTLFDNLNVSETRQEDLQSRSAFISAGDSSLNVEASQTPQNFQGRFQMVWAIQLIMFER